MPSESNLIVDRKGLNTEVTIDDINRVLEVGRLLLSVLTEEELEELQRLIHPDVFHEGQDK